LTDLGNKAEQRQQALDDQSVSGTYSVTEQSSRSTKATQRTAQHLQQSYDLKLAYQTAGKQIEREVVRGVA
jgi:hypothetical protein